MGIILEQLKEPLDIPEALKSILGTGEYEIARFIDSDVYDNEDKVYNVYKITTNDGVFVLKKSEDEDYFKAEVKHFGLLQGLPVPEFLGASEGFVLTRFAEGEDLKLASDEGVEAAAKSLARIMNAYPMGRGYERERYDRYLRRLEKRAGYLKDEPELKAAFGLFFERQKEIPLTLSNSDLLPLNVLYDGQRAVIIDWEFGGFMPYALDIARFIAHGISEEIRFGSPTPFRMTDEQKRLFVDSVYEKLFVKPEREVYDRDIRIAVFNEFIEILEYYLGDPTVERDAAFNMYYPAAKELAAIMISAESKEESK